MARIKSNIDEVIADMKELAESFNEAADAVLTAQAAVYVTEWKNAIREGQHIVTGSMLENVQATEPKTENGSRKVFVYPQGQDDRGVRNALKAYVTHYGRGKKMKSGDKFVTKAEKSAETEAERKGVEAFGAWLEGRK